MEHERIPIEVFFGDPEVMQVEVSPDGRYVSYLAPWEGVKNVWVMDLKTKEHWPVTRDRGRGIAFQGWMPNGEQIIYLQDEAGDENWRIYAVGLRGGEPLLLTPGQGVQARPLKIHPNFPDEILVLVNDRNPTLHDVYRVNTQSGERWKVLENPGFVDFLADENFEIRLAYRQTEDGGGEVLEKQGKKWAPRLNWGLDDDLTTRPLEVRGNTLYLMSSLGRDTGALVAFDLTSGEARVLAEDPNYDLPHFGLWGSGLLFHPSEKTPEAVAVMRDRLGWIPLQQEVADDLERLGELEAGDFYITSRDAENKKWVVAVVSDRKSPRYYLYDRGAKKASLLFVTRPRLDEYTLAERKPVRYRARDGLVIEAYLTLPPHKPPKNLPAVVLVHGGPWHRDEWGLDLMAQWLANRGFAVLQPNFRGSTGYGKAFVNAGNKEWGRKMQHDITDGVRWLIEEGIADPKRIGIMGGSYGGYATLAGLAFTPELYSAGVDIVGPSNLFTLLESVPPYWKPMLALFYERMGHPEKDRALLRERSPLFSADRIQAPLLIGQGANDPRVKRAESLQIVEALKAKGKPVEYVEYPDEGHGFFKAENRLDFYRRAERFLETHLKP